MENLEINDEPINLGGPLIGVPIGFNGKLSEPSTSNVKRKLSLYTLNPEDYEGEIKKRIQNAVRCKKRRNAVKEETERMKKDAIEMKEEIFNLKVANAIKEVIIPYLNEENQEKDVIIGVLKEEDQKKAAIIAKLGEEKKELLLYLQKAKFKIE